MQKKTKAIVIIAAVFIIVAVLPFLQPGTGRDISNVNRTIPPSGTYSKQDISDAMEIVEEQFKINFDGCTLTDLWYDEDTSAASSDEWAAQYHKDEAIILLSNFNVDSSGGDGSLEPNSTYTNWQWILVRDHDSNTWELETWGYG